MLDADDVIIIGPAEAKTGLFKQISENKTTLDKVRLVESADSMSQNQVVALLKKYFENIN